jgi:hypothetical protein
MFRLALTAAVAKFSWRCQQRPNSVATCRHLVISTLRSVVRWIQSDGLHVTIRGNH